MSRIALTRLLVTNNRPARRRLIGIVTGIVVGVTLFLMLLVAVQAFPERNMRSSWASAAPIPDIPGQSDYTNFRPDHILTASESTIVSNFNVAGNQVIIVLRVTLPKSGTASVRISGSDIAPEPDEYLASSTLVKRIASLPANQLDNRYGKQIEVLSPEAAEGPDSLVVVAGTNLGIVSASDFYTPPQMVTSFQGTPYENEAYRIATTVGAIVVLVPALLLIRIVTDLEATQRAERFVTLCPIGATSQQAARTVALEIGATTLVSALAGVALYLVLTPPAAQIMPRSNRSHYSDLLRSLTSAALVVVMTTTEATTVAWWRT